MILPLCVKNRRCSITTICRRQCPDFTGRRILDMHCGSGFISKASMREHRRRAEVFRSMIDAAEQEFCGETKGWESWRSLLLRIRYREAFILQGPPLMGAAL